MEWGLHAAAAVSKPPSSADQHGSPAGLARAFAGAVLFSLPMFMTMEMWWLGFTMKPWQMIAMLVGFFPLLVALSHAFGFEETLELKDDVVDALVAFAVAFVASAAMLWVIGEISGQMSSYERIGKIVVQTIPASTGALLAQSQLGESHNDEADDRGDTRYLAELALMAGGALLLCFNIAPTEEVMVIAHRLTDLHVIGVIVLSIMLIDVFAYGSMLRGRHQRSTDSFWLGDVVRFSVVGYAVSVLIAAFVLWCFGRFEGMWVGESARLAIVLALPASLGAGAARLVL